MTKKLKRKLKGAGIAVGAIATTALLLFTGAAVKASSRLARKYETHRIGLALPQPSDAAPSRAGSTWSKRVTAATPVTAAAWRVV
jgi:hypothetical protein